MAGAHEKDVVFSQDVYLRRANYINATAVKWTLQQLQHQSLCKTHESVREKRKFHSMH